MHVPQAFKMKDDPWAFADIHNFGILVDGCSNHLTANHVPLLVDEQRRQLRGHLARTNPQWRNFQGTREVLVIFSGAQAYISPNWYVSEGLVPTWNFSAVHMRGTVALLDEACTLEIIQQLSAKHEAPFDPPWTTSKMPAHKLAAMLRAIVGFRVNVDQVQAQAKLSQNRLAEDRNGLIRGLQGQADADSQAVARQMQRVSSTAV